LHVVNPAAETGQVSTPEVKLLAVQPGLYVFVKRKRQHFLIENDVSNRFKLALL